MTVEDRLRAAHSRIPEPDPETVARARERLAAAIDADRVLGGEIDAGSYAVGPDGAPRPGARGVRRPLRLALPAAALALAAAAAVALLPHEAERPIARPAATPFPEAASLLAAGKVLYQRNTFHMSIKYIGADGRGTLRPRDAAYAISRSVPEDIWLAPDGSARVVYGAESPAYLPSPADERAWRAAGAPDLEALMGPSGRWGPKERDYPPGSYLESWLFNSNLEAVLPKEDPLSVLPREPRALTAFLEEAARKQRPGGDERLVRNAFASDIVTFLRHQVTPPDLRAALIEVAKAIPGVRALGEITDSAGRTVTAIQLPDDMEDGLVLAFDPATSRLMAQGIKVADGFRWTMTYAIATAAVPKLGDRP